jgi:hypothetical protein
MNVNRLNIRLKAAGRWGLRLGAVALAAWLLALGWPGAMPALAQSVGTSVTTGPPGTSVTVSGSGFTDGDNYQITFAPATAYEQLLAASTTISGTTFTRAVSIPAAPWGQYTIAVVTNRGTYSPSFQVTSQISLAIATGYVGDTVGATGLGFRASTTVNLIFNGSNVASTTSNIYGNLNQFNFVVPSLPRGDYNVYGMDGIATSPNVVFTIRPRLTISPQDGAVGSQVQLTGTGFGPSYGMTIYFDSQVISSNVVASATGAFTTTLTVPNAVRGSHQIIARDVGLSSSTATFTVRPAITISPASGPPGTVVGVTGHGFRPSVTVRITYNNANVTTQPASVSTDTTGTFTASFTVPSVVSGSYAVNASDGVYSATASFAVSSDIDISPATGNIGGELIVSGTGFTPAGRVALTYDDQSVMTVSADNTGSFSVSFNVPASAAGPHTISARDLTAPGVVASASFTVESVAPPVPNLLTPPYSTMTDTQPRFTWSPVTDPSGVTYKLQVARDAAFSQLILSREGIILPEYQIGPSEQLQLTKSDNPYYWRAKAVDGAGNESDWTAAGSFYTQDSTPPEVPALFTPASDSQASLQPKFTWSAVSDASGVTYDLQVTRDAGFTQIVLFKQGLTQPEYQVTQAEQLQLTKRPAPYYWRVRASDGAANTSDWTVAALFYTEDSAPPPVPAPLNPENGSRTGAAVLFDWTDVTDPSGVAYNLEVAQDSEFTHLVVFKEGLSESQYKLTSVEELTSSTGTPASPYYWRVRSVDSTQNVSAWSAINAFYVSGFQLRGWLLAIVIILGGALLLAGGVFIGMKLRPGKPPEESGESE